MADGSQAIFSALDNAKTQLYHFKAIVIAGMGFFTDAYDLFCITAVTKLIGRLYYYDPIKNEPGKLPTNVSNAITGVALCGTLAGQLFFGWLGDKLGRKHVYGITLVTMVGCAVASGLSFGSTAHSVIASLCFFRFWLGFGIGGDYPLSAVIMSEYANQKTRGAFIAAVFAMQGIGILVAGAVSMIVSKAFLVAYKAEVFSQNHVLSTQPQGDFVWRIVLMFGAVPAMLTYYWRMKMPETARFTALVKGNHEKAAVDMAKVLEQDIVVEESKPKIPVTPSPSYGLLSREFVKRHGLQLLGTTSTWFLLDIAFYSLQLTQKDIYPAIGLVPKASTMNAIEEVYKISKAMFLVALFATVPGYWFTVFLIDRIGRFIIQLGGFLLMSIFMAVIGFLYDDLRGDKKKCPKESTNEFCEGKPYLAFPGQVQVDVPWYLSCSRESRAIIGAFLVQSYTQNVGDIKRAIVALSMVNLIGFFLSFLIPETKGKSLEQLSGEDQNGGDGEGGVKTDEKV
ncbi:putative inorganic phosphate transporter 1-3 [Vitis vinifera]|uniref:Putative inorganic phosphate transporter 1-3 n=1 Tax=Vitis vinifera TaxID=29760 RepID=A0A438E3S6_VITVI|nr:putative inorganic phosphate transporter 1-3 [Vitis vinifera]